MLHCVIRSRAVRRKIPGLRTGGFLAYDALRLVRIQRSPVVYYGPLAQRSAYIFYTDGVLGSIPRRATKLVKWIDIL